MRSTQFKAAEAVMLQNMQPSVHDTGHVYRVLYGALRIAKTEPKANLDVVILSALLHDIGRLDARVGQSHAQLGAELAHAMLPPLGWDEITTTRVAECISTHSYKAGLPPKTLEAKILFDADKLDLCGAIGCGRALLFGAEIGEPWYHMGPNGLPAKGKKSEPPSLYREYNHKLKLLHTRFFTKKGRRMAAKRQAAMDDWFAALRREVNGGYKKGQALLAKALR